MKTTVRLSAEYECYPVWVITERDLDNVPPSSLPLTKQLIDDLDRWGDEYEATYNRDDPANSDFASEESEQRWVKRGRELARRLREELDDTWRVSYFDLSTESYVEID